MPSKKISFGDEQAAEAGGNPASLVSIKESDAPSSVAEQMLRSEGETTLDDPTFSPTTGHGAPGRPASRSGMSGSSGGSSKGSLKNYMRMSMSNGPACLKKVPFEYQVMIALLIPVCFIIGILSTLLAGHQAEYQFIHDNIHLAERSEEFQAVLNAERDAVGLYYAVNETNVTETKRTLGNYDQLGGDVDAAWDRLLDSLTQVSSKDDLMNEARKQIVKQHSELSSIRKDVRRREKSGKEARMYYTRFVVESERIVRALMKNELIGNSLPSLVGLTAARHFLNYFGLVHTLGNEITHRDQSVPIPTELYYEYVFAVDYLAEANVVNLDIAEGPLRPAIHAWREHPDTIKAFDFIYALYNRTHTFTAKEFEAVTHIPMEALSDLLLEKVKSTLGDEEKQETIETIILMVCATVVSILAATFIVYWQMKIAKNIFEQQQTLVEVSEVVSSFVPKAFLRTMGTRSIMQISSGQHVNVATTMVFSDIRNFTNLSERMTNEKLFFWLQRYFALMTRVNDSHKGTIDKFIGDAIFSFFARPADAVRCGIDMQSVVVFLNSTLSPENLVQLGVGIHHGVVAFGVFGDENRRTCTMVSSEVNLASRLEGLTKKYGVKILVSEQAMAQIDTENFHHEVLNPMELAHHSASDDHHARASAYHQSDVANDRDVAEADYDEDECVTVLGERLLGEVAVKGSGRLVKIHEVYQSDEVQVRKYKSKSKDIFEEAVKLQLKKARGHRDSLKNHNGEYNPLRRRSDEDAAEAAEKESISTANRTLNHSGLDFHVGSAPPTDSGESDAILSGRPSLPGSIMSASPVNPKQGIVKTIPITTGNTEPHHQNGAVQLHSVFSFDSEYNSTSTSPRAGLPPLPSASPMAESIEDTLTIKILSLYNDCQKMAEEFGVEDPVIAVKRAQAMKGGVDVFNAK